MKQAIAHTAEHAASYRIAITTALLFGCAVCVALYASSLYSIVSGTVALKQASMRALSVSSELAELDSRYLKLVSAITPDTLASHGFAPGAVAVYIKRSQPTASLQTQTLAQAGHEL